MHHDEGWQINANTGLATFIWRPHPPATTLSIKWVIYVLAELSLFLQTACIGGISAVGYRSQQVQIATHSWVSLQTGNQNRVGWQRLC